MLPTVGRFAPSPSGPMHLGNARTALLAWLDARARGGRVLLRIEDLDRERSRPAFAELIRRDLRWLGLDWDAETRPQSEREPAYDEALERLVAAGAVYECFCTRRDLAAASAPHGGLRPHAGGCAALTPAEREARRAAGRRPALRARMPAASAEVDDRLHGRVRVALEDVVLRRSDGGFAYQLAVVVDDAADGVTDVVRGDDLLASAGVQAELARLLGLPAPACAHVPLVLGPDGSRLAKRHGAIAVSELRDGGMPAERLVALLARSAGLTAAERVRPAALVDGFALERVSREPATLGALAA